MIATVIQSAPLAADCCAATPPVAIAPPAADLLKKAAGISKGSGKPNREKVGTISMAKIEEIAKTKIQLESRDGKT